MVIRDATAADRDRLQAMTLRFLAETPYGTLLGAPLRLATLIDTVLEHGVILVAEMDSDQIFPVGTRGYVPPGLVGMLALVAVTHPLSGQLYADEIAWWVEPDYRHSWVGVRLLKAGEAWAKSRELTLLKMVAPAGTDIGKFYERLGYTVVESAYQKSL